jgi:hypothetical protein
MMKICLFLSLCLAVLLSGCGGGSTPQTDTIRGTYGEVRCGTPAVVRVILTREGKYYDYGEAYDKNYNGTLQGIHLLPYGSGQTVYTGSESNPDYCSRKVTWLSKAGDIIEVAKVRAWKNTPDGAVADFDLHEDDPSYFKTEFKSYRIGTDGLLIPL